MKSRSLLPQQEDDLGADEGPDPLEELRRQLIEYQKYKDVALVLREKDILEKDVFTRSYYEDPMVKGEEGPGIEELSLFDLLSALQNILKKGGHRDALMEVTAEQISVKDKITWLLEMLKDNKNVTFDSLFLSLTSKMEIVSTFLALLELIKLQAVRVLQQMPFGTIFIYSIENNQNSIAALSDSVDEFM